jgi:hypothetical protein
MMKIRMVSGIKHSARFAFSAGIVAFGRFAQQQLRECLCGCEFTDAVDTVEDVCVGEPSGFKCPS